MTCSYCGYFGITEKKEKKDIDCCFSINNNTEVIGIILFFLCGPFLWCFSRCFGETEIK